MEELARLVTQSRSGDLDAFGRIVRRFQRMACGCAYSHLGDFHLAEDAAQEAFVEAYSRLPDLRHPQAFPGWFRRIVLKHCDRFTRRRNVETVPLEAASNTPADGVGPDRLTEQREIQERVLASVRALPERQRMATTLFYIDGYSQQEISDFLDVPVTTVKKRLHDARQNLKERMLDMVDETLKNVALPDDFADVVVRRVASESDLKSLVEQMGGGHYESEEDARRKEMFVVEEAGEVRSAGHLGTTDWAIGATVLKAARSGAGIAGESDGVPDPRFVKGYRAHFKLAHEAGCCLALVHGSQYDHAFCGFVPAFYYPIATLLLEKAKTIRSGATVREAGDEDEVAAGKAAYLRDPYATKINAFLGGGKMHVVEQDGMPAGYLRVAPNAHAQGKPYGMPFGHVSHITVNTRDAALAVVKLAGELAEKAGFENVCILESHMTRITQAMLSLGGAYRLHPACDQVGLDAEMAAILDLAALTERLKPEFETRLNASAAHRLNGRFSIELAGTVAGFVAENGQVKIVTQKQQIHRVLPRWVLTRLYMGYYSGEDVLAMGALPCDRSDGKTPDHPDLDMLPLQLPEIETELFKALFPKLWPCATPDPDVWPWVIGKDYPRYQHEEAKSDHMKAEIDALKLPWIGY